MTTVRRARWAISFADLCLLLLGFFVLLQASGQRPDQVVSQVSQYFGGQAEGRRIDMLAADLFEPGEAMLTDRGRTLLKKIGAQHIHNKDIIQISSAGQDAGSRRLDGWELAAARLAAIARAFREAGVPDSRMRLRGLDEQAQVVGGQHILIWQEEERKAKD
ncbi:flagellar motor protein MotB [Rhizorhapis sp. SPR117]|uniref:flagellar motor protein MotB n=1 Tax=Rhizorhapis sp. SPR117 TaxID=2912611 RepID=UPI001F18B54F|nr:OmpA family protein [Rhizorhapis sp. SPR117]